MNEQYRVNKDNIIDNIINAKNEKNIESATLTHLADKSDVYKQNTPIQSANELPTARTRPITLDKNENMRYNKFESEGVLNEQIDRGRQEEINKEFDGRGEGENLEGSISESGLFEKYMQKEYTEREYREWEKSIKPKSDNELSIEENDLRTDIKYKTEKDTVFIKSSNQVIVYY